MSRASADILHPCRDGAPPALYTLVELNKYHPEIIKEKKLEIYIDGGVRRGTDVVKALCLGATGVGAGRPFLYGLCYGVEGVEKTIESERTDLYLFSVLY